MTFEERLTEDRRGIILRVLQETTDYRLNEDSLARALQHMGHTSPRDVVRQDLRWLEEHRLLEIDRMRLVGGAADELWVGVLTKLGAEVADGRRHEGVARQTPRR